MKRLLIIFTAGLTAFIVLFLLQLWIPEWMAKQYHFANTKDFAEQVSANRTAFNTFLGGFAVAITVYFTYGNFKLAQQTFKIAQSNLRLTEDRSVTDTFAKAVEQLGNSDASVRLGGIYSLSRIARTSETDYFPIMQVLTGFLRSRYGAPVAPLPDPSSSSPGLSRCPVEVQAALAIVGDHYWPTPQGYSLDLSYIQVSDAWVVNSDLSDIYFWCVNLDKCNFSGAKLIDADFRDSTFTNCEFTDADITRANFKNARIIKPNGLTRAQLDSAINVDHTVYQELL